MKRRALILSLPLLLLAAIFGVRWWQTRPSPAENWLRKTAQETVSIEITRGTSMSGLGETSRRAIIMDRHLIQQVLMSFPCKGDLTNPRVLNIQLDDASYSNRHYVFELGLANKSFDYLTLCQDSDGRWCLIRQQTPRGDWSGAALIVSSQQHQLLTLLNSLLDGTQPGNFFPEKKADGG